MGRDPRGRGSGRWGRQFISSKTIGAPCALRKLQKGRWGMVKGHAGGSAVARGQTTELVGRGRRSGDRRRSSSRPRGRNCAPSRALSRRGNTHAAILRRGARAPEGNLTGAAGYDPGGGDLRPATGLQGLRRRRRRRRSSARAGAGCAARVAAGGTLRATSSVSALERPVGAGAGAAPARRGLGSRAGGRARPGHELARGPCPAPGAARPDGAERPGAHDSRRSGPRGRARPGSPGS